MFYVKNGSMYLMDMTMTSVWRIGLHLRTLHTDSSLGHLPNVL